MRNLKKILSLALALVMVFSLMTFASAKDFSDSDAIEHTEAVEVLTALEVIDGVGNNTFNPTGKVTRAQMAKMITLISLGNVSVDAFKGTTTDLNDINGHWAEAYIKYCYSQGIISGKGGGKFDPDANVTAVEAAKMLLVAIGYNSDVQIYEGPQWAVNVIRDAQLSGFFYQVALPAETQLNRDQSAQMMYNALNADIIEKTSIVDRTDGSISDQYIPKKGYSLLNKAFDGQIWVGVFGGNHDFNANGAAEGEISVQGDLEADYDPDKNTTGSGSNGWAHFPYDYDIANIGEEVKVIFKDGTMGKKGEPDKNDTIYGVYKTGATSVVNATRDNVADQKNGKAQIKVSGTIYNTEDTVDVYFNFDADNAPTALNVSAIQADANSALTTLLKAQKSDLIKLILNDKNKVETVYVTEFKAGRVSSVTSSKVTIDGVGAIDIEDNNIYDGIAVDDVAVYTKFYEKDKDDAYFTITLAETVEGALTGYKKSNSNRPGRTDFDNVVIAGTTYKLYDKDLENLSDDKVTTSDLTDSSSKVGDEVRAFMVNGMVAGIQALEESGGKFALVVDKTSGGALGSNLDPIRVTVLLPDGTEQTLKVHKDSVSDGRTTGNTAVTEATLANGVLIEYSSITDDTIKIYDVATPVTLAATDASGSALLWDKDAKTLAYTNDTPAKRAVAASNATMFVVVDKLAASNPGNNDGQLDRNEDYYAYDMRSLSDIVNTATTGRKVAFYRNDDGLVTAAYVVLTNRPTRGGDNTLYGIVTSEGGYVEESGTGYRTYTIDAGKDEPLSIMVESTIAARNLRKGELVEFDESSDGKYVAGDFTPILDSDNTPHSGWTLGAIYSYDATARRLSYFTGTSRASLTASFAGLCAGADDPTKPISVTATSDVKFAYIDSDNTTGGDEMSLRKFNTANGYANVLFHTDDSGLVDVIVYEVSGEGNLAIYGDSTDKASASFGVTTLSATADTPIALTTPGADVNNTITVGGATKNGTVSVEANTARVTLTVTLASGQSLSKGGANADKVTIGSNGVVTVDTDSIKTTGGTLNFTLTVSQDDKTSITYIVALTVAKAPFNATGKDATEILAAIETETNKTLTVSGTISLEAELAIPATAKVTFAGDVGKTASGAITVPADAEVTFNGGVAAPVTVNGGKVTVASGKSIDELTGGTGTSEVTGAVTTLADNTTGTLKITGDVGTITNVTSGKVEITGNVTTKIADLSGGEVEIKGTGNKITLIDDVTGAATVKGNVDEITDVNANLTVTGDVGKIGVTDGTVNITGTVGNVTDVASAKTLNVTGDITKITDMNGSIKVTGAVGTIEAISGGTLTLAGATATSRATATLTAAPSAAATIDVKANGTLTLDASAAAVDVSTVLTLTGVEGATVVIVNGTNPAVVKVADDLFYTDAADAGTKTQTPDAGTYIFGDVTGTSGGFVKQDA